MMKRYLLTVLCLLAFFPLLAQMPLPADELKNNPNLSANNTAVYPGPVQARLTPPPAGKKPFFLSHYGRHGSRYLTKNQDYDYVANVLDRAYREQKLSDLGVDVFRRVQLLQKEADDRLGELTPLGIQQHKDIARRMVERFPEVFRDNVVVDARSTLVPRCILSMSAALQQLVSMNPKLRISENASLRDMYYMNQHDRKLQISGASLRSRKDYRDYYAAHACWQRMVKSLFNDTVYMKSIVNGERLNYFLFRLAGDVQNTSEGQEMTLYDIYTDEEILANWQIENVFWYLSYGHAPSSGGNQPYVQRNLLRRIVEQADSCIGMERPGAMLRFGHDTVLLPLVCLMGLNGYDARIGDLDSVDRRGWACYRIFPMACNVQLVFYRKNLRDKDVLVKILLNENEATLPIESSMAPYYRWADVREYFLHKLSLYVGEE